MLSSHCFQPDSFHRSFHYHDSPHLHTPLTTWPKYCSFSWITVAMNSRFRSSSRKPDSSSSVLSTQSPKSFSSTTPQIIVSDWFSWFWWSNSLMCRGIQTFIVVNKRYNNIKNYDRPSWATNNRKHTKTYIQVVNSYLELLPFFAKLIE